MGGVANAVKNIVSPSKPSAPAPVPPPAVVVQDRKKEATNAAKKDKRRARKARGARSTLSARGFTGILDTALGPTTNKL